MSGPYFSFPSKYKGQEVQWLWPRLFFLKDVFRVEQISQRLPKYGSRRYLTGNTTGCSGGGIGITG